jgi:serine/threonine protein kinase
MGTVYLGVTPQQLRSEGVELDAWAPLALKVLHAGEPAVAEAFQRECSFTLQIKHPGIVRGLVKGIHAGKPFLVTEFCHGWTLSALMDALAEGRVRMTVPLAAHIVSEVARALSAVHRGRVVHRDICPDNVMVSFDGSVKLLDFGIAARIGDRDAQVLRGREEYRAPETKGSKSYADERGDFYSLGVIFWRLLSGRRSSESFLDRREWSGEITACGPMRPSIFNPACSAEADELALRLLEVRPGARPGPEELDRALAKLIPGGFDGQAELVRQLRLCADVGLQKEMLQEDVEHVKKWTQESGRPVAGGDVRWGFGKVFAIAMSMLLSGGDDHGAPLQEADTACPLEPSTVVEIVETAFRSAQGHKTSGELGLVLWSKIGAGAFSASANCEQQRAVAPEPSR